MVNGASQNVELRLYATIQIVIFPFYQIIIIYIYIYISCTMLNIHNIMIIYIYKGIGLQLKLYFEGLPKIYFIHFFIQRFLF